MNRVRSETGQRRRSFVLRYTLLFLVISALVFFPFLRCGRSFVNKVDGMSQYIVYLRYMGQYLRLCLKNILHGHFALPMYDFSIGMGDDIGQIVRFHPMDFLSVFVPSAYTEILYNVIVLLRFYLAGLAFCAYAFYLNHVIARSDTSSEKGVYGVNVLSGSLVYVFSGFMLIRVLNHPIYAAPFIVLPLLLLGAEKVLAREGCALFVFSVFLGFWSNYYFMYIMSAGLLLYMVVRYFETVRPAGARSFLSLFFRMAGLYLFGLAMSMMTLLPTLLRYLGSSRQTQASETQSMLFYADKRRYIAWFLNLISPLRSSGNGTDLNFAVIVLPCLAVLFTMSARHLKSLKKFLIADLVMLLVPFFGFVLAVMNNENNRWMFLIAICLGMTVVFTADAFADLTQRQAAAMLLAAGLFLAAAVLQTLTKGRDLYNTAAAAELVLCTAALLYCSHRKISVRKIRCVVLGITCASVVLNGYMTYSPRFGNEVHRYIRSGKVLRKYDTYWRSRGAALLEEDSFYRVEGFAVKHGRENSSEYSGYNSTSEYNSILNADMLEAMKTLNNVDLSAVTSLKGLDARPVSMNLAHVRYYIVWQKNKGSVPYGYSKEPAAQKGKILVYENETPLALGYSYGAYIRREAFEKLDPLEKELVQLEAAVLPKAEDGQADLEQKLQEAGLFESTEPSDGILRREVEIPKQGENFTYADGKLRASSKATVPLTVEAREGYDAYLLLDGVRINRQTASLEVSDGSFTTRTMVRSSEQVYNIGREEYLFHLGYAGKDETKTVTLRFAAGKYRLGGAQVLYVPMEGYEEKIGALNEESLMDEQVEDGRITGRVSLQAPKLMTFSVPSAAGWTLKVDGQKTDLLTLNLMYQGALLPAGDHEISLTYTTPGLTTGCCIAIPAILAFIVLALTERKRRRGQSAQRKTDV